MMVKSEDFLKKCKFLEELLDVLGMVQFIFRLNREI